MRRAAHHRRGALPNRYYFCDPGPRRREFIELLEAIDRQTPAHLTAIHLVCDNVITHKGKLVHAWLAKHPRLQFYCTPVHCSWMNQVE